MNDVGTHSRAARASGLRQRRSSSRRHTRAVAQCDADCSVSPSSLPSADWVAGIALKNPIVAGHLIVQPKRTVCRLADHEVIVEIPGRLMAELAQRCDGRTPLAEVLAELGTKWDRAELDALVNALAEQRVLCDAAELPALWWQHIKNPRTVGGRLDENVPAELTNEAAGLVRVPAKDVDYHVAPSTPFTELLKRRASTRTFADQAVPFENILSLLWSAYGASDRRTVPSAGGIYPLQVYFINLRRSGDLQPGIYRVNYLEGCRLGLRLLAETTVLVSRVFVDPAILTFAQGVVVIAGELGRTARKYVTRSALYVPLEAGHAAQNVLLAAVEADLGAVELGGFAEDRLSDLLGLPTGLLPMTSVVLGMPPSVRDREVAEKEPIVDFNWIEFDGLPYVPPFALGTARVAGTEGVTGWGKARDPKLANTKAVAEALERWCCTMPTGLVEATHSEVADAIQAQDIVAYSDEQYLQPDFPHSPIDLTAKYLWKSGMNVLTGRSASVLADFVYYGCDLGQERSFTSTSSSGAAAFTSQEGALERATLELIERDAFMATWLSRTNRPTIDPRSLPWGVVVRLLALRDVGIDVICKDHSRGFAPVVFLFAQCVAQGFTIATAGSAFDVESALESALAELEAVVANRVLAVTSTSVRPEEVRSPHDHMHLYTQRRFFRRADVLADGGDVIQFSEVGKDCPMRWADLVNLLANRGYRLLWFDLTQPGVSLRQGRMPLHIGRAIIPGLLPISFGFGVEPIGTYQSDFFAGLHRRPKTRRAAMHNLFPHPFG